MTFRNPCLDLALISLDDRWRIGINASNQLTSNSIVAKEDLKLVFTFLERPICLHASCVLAENDHHLPKEEKKRRRGSNDFWFGKLMQKSKGNLPISTSERLPLFRSKIAAAVCASFSRKFLPFSRQKSTMTRRFGAKNWTAVSSNDVGRTENLEVFGVGIAVGLDGVGRGRRLF